MSSTSYRIRTNIGEEPNVLNVKLEQTYDTLEILSLKLDQEDYYKLRQSNYGIIVGRVLANGGFGIPNAKISVFIAAESNEDYDEKLRYPYKTITDTNTERLRYNLLPDATDEKCHQDVGSFPNKRLLLDNEDIIEVFDKYYKYTTRTNSAGDYMIYGVPTGMQQIHVDIDMSDIGILSQKPTDMMYKGYNIEMFESPTKFKSSSNLDSLAQLYSQNVGVFVYPFWGDTTSNDNIAITRCDIQIQYTFEPTCVFLGSIMTENGNVHIGKDCAPSNSSGKMDELITKAGTIEMIRKTNEGTVEEFSIKGNRLIDENGVWCYQIPMNLDYITTDEYGNIVPTDNPEKGIPTRARVRFRISLDDNGEETALKLCKYLVPNNPRVNDEHPSFTDNYDADYEFGTKTSEESYRDLFWNCVYTVKSYIPRIQVEDHNLNDMDSGKMAFNGIKWVNHHGNTNPMPYNGVNIKLTFSYKFICILTKVLIQIIAFINEVIISTIGQLLGAIADLIDFKIPLIGRPFGWLAKALSKLVPQCISISTEFCDTGDKIKYYPGCWGAGKYSSWGKSKKEASKNGYQASNKPKLFGNEANNPLIACVENQLAQENECTNFYFANDWINGTLFFPQWRRSIKPKTSFLFGLIKKRAKDEWCSADRNVDDFYVIQQCAVSNMPTNNECGNSCHKRIDGYKMKKGVIRTKETMLGQTVYYYKSVNYDKALTADRTNNTNNYEGNVVLLFATDIVLLGTLDNCNQEGIPQFFKFLPITTYNIPSPLLDVTTNVTTSIDFGTDNQEITTTFTRALNATGQDWGLVDNNAQCGKAKDGDGGLFYGIGCSSIEMKPKSCVNLRRICELGVNIDETKEINTPTDNGIESANLYPDGFISWDELYNNDVRSMFASMNGNNLRTKLDTNTGYKVYNFPYLHLDNFDGALKNLMMARQKKCDASYKENYKLETASVDYIKFRMGEEQYYYKPSNGNAPMRTMPRYENSLYFYFGLKPGSTAIETFNNLYFAECETDTIEETPLDIIYFGNSWCCDDTDKSDGIIRLNLSEFAKPVTINIQGYAESADEKTDLTISNVFDDKVYLGRNLAQITENENMCLSNSEINERLQLIGENYKQLSQDNNNPYVLLNGDYVIRITDMNNRVSTSQISYKGNDISTEIYPMDFTITNEDLKLKFNPTDNGFEISQNKEGLDYNSNLGYFTRTIGGIVTLKNLSMGETPLSFENDVFISVRCVDKTWQTEEESEIDLWYIDSDNTNNFLVYNDNMIAFGVPEGAKDYIISISPKCNKKQTFIYNLTISENNSFKLYINGIDYDIIRNFRSGYQNTQKINTNESDGIYGWNRMSKIKANNIEDVVPYDYSIERIKAYLTDCIEYLKEENEKGEYCPYNWTDNYRYEAEQSPLDYLENKLKDELMIEISDDYDKDILYRIMYIFMQNSNSLYNDISYSVESLCNSIKSQIIQFEKYTKIENVSEWNETKTYIKNNIVYKTNNNEFTFYKCIVDTTVGNWNLSNWDILEVRPYDTTMKYDISVYVNVDNNLYAKYKKIEDVTEWSDTGKYKVNDIVYKTENNNFVFLQCTDDKDGIYKWEQLTVNKYDPSIEYETSSYVNVENELYIVPGYNKHSLAFNSLFLYEFQDNKSSEILSKVVEGNFIYIRNENKYYQVVRDNEMEEVSYNEMISQQNEVMELFVNILTEYYEMYSDIIDIMQARRDLTLEMRQAFYIDREAQELNITTTTQFLPVTYNISYIPEYDTEIDNVEYRRIQSSNYKTLNEKTLSDIMIANIGWGRYTCYSGQNGRQEIVNKNASRIKAPYQIRITNGLSQSLPTDNMFDVVFIDKTFGVIGSCIAGIKTDSMSAPGYFYGCVLNGIPNKIETVNNKKYAVFDTCTFGDTKIPLLMDDVPQWINEFDAESKNESNSFEGEDSINTIRNIKFENEEIHKYNNGKITYNIKELPLDTFYTTELVVENEYNSMTQQIIAQADIYVESSSLDVTNNNNYLTIKFGCSANLSSDAKWRLLIYEPGQQKYRHYPYQHYKKYGNEYSLPMSLDDLFNYCPYMRYDYSYPITSEEKTLANESINYKGGPVKEIDNNGQWNRASDKGNNLGEFQLQEFYPHPDYPSYKMFAVVKDGVNIIVSQLYDFADLLYYEKIENDTEYILPLKCDYKIEAVICYTDDDATTTEDAAKIMADYQYKGKTVTAISVEKDKYSSIKHFVVIDEYNIQHQLL